MTPAAPERLVRLLGGDDLEWLRQRVRQSLEAGRPVASVSLRSPTPAQRAAVAGLLGRGLPTGGTLILRPADVEAVVRHSGTAPDLATAVALLDGPLTDRRAERESAQAEREAPFGAARSWLAVQAVTLAWVDECSPVLVRASRGACSALAQAADGGALGRGHRPAGCRVRR